MDTKINSSFQIRLIAFGLLAIIPITILLGLSFMFPITDWDTYKKLETEYLEKNMPDYDQYKKLAKSYNVATQNSTLFSSHNEYVKQWQKSKEYKKLKKQDKKHEQYRMVTLCFLIIAIMSILIFIRIPIIHDSIMSAALFLFIFNLSTFSMASNEFFLFIPLVVLRILTSLICLLLTVYCVHKNNY